MNIWSRTALFGVVLALSGGGVSSAKNPLLPDKEEAVCGDYGTSVQFEDSPVDAARQAKKEGKLVMVLHISGHFEDASLT